VRATFSSGHVVDRHHDPGDHLDRDHHRDDQGPHLGHRDRDHHQDHRNSCRVRRGDQLTVLLGHASRVRRDVMDHRCPPGHDRACLPANAPYALQRPLSGEHPGEARGRGWVRRGDGSLRAAAELDDLSQAAAESDGRSVPTLAAGQADAEWRAAQTIAAARACVFQVHVFRVHVFQAHVFQAHVFRVPVREAQTQQRDEESHPFPMTRSVPHS
jgi:hypothetical protein